MRHWITTAIRMPDRDILRTRCKNMAVRWGHIIREECTIICRVRSNYRSVRIYLLHYSNVSGSTWSAPAYHSTQLRGLSSFIAILSIAPVFSCVQVCQSTGISTHSFHKSTRCEKCAVRHWYRTVIIPTTPYLPIVWICCNVRSFQSWYI